MMIGIGEKGGGMGGLNVYKKSHIESHTNKISSIKCRS